MRIAFLIFMMFLLWLPTLSGAIDISKLSIEEKICMFDKNPTDQITINRYRTLIDMIQERDKHSNRVDIAVWAGATAEKMAQSGVRETGLSVLESVNRILAVSPGHPLTSVFALYGVLRRDGYDPKGAIEYATTHDGW